ncbi:GNAT family N-acetyltransferase [Pukyongiella litopenaei]|uniref:GNAT family N-acetyltransferase n=1 Tax=Pukyongiella litopenaei TaxID=2605946 RepID=A0A2S0MNM5_9RHOB|nr:GNAT family N-acetyltransferase [Pukyongiella litopenaei]AVO37480.1 GNAT family N-acetyltransferase [Pukyongiella litopenaei]
MTNTYRIRPYRPEDRPRLLEIWRSASEIAHPFFTAAQLDDQQRLVGDIYLEQAETHVAVDAAGQPLGFIGLLDNFIGGLFVAPALHGRGIGRGLVRHALSDRDGLELEAYAANTGAIGFYRGLGFTEMSRRGTDDNGLPFELVRLRLSR